MRAAIRACCSSAATAAKRFELNKPLFQHPTRRYWQPGAGGMCLHSIVPWPGEPDRLAIGISAAGVWLTDDGGQSWSRGNEGLVANYVPEGTPPDQVPLCVHRIHRAPTRPERLFLQFHGGVYRSDDAGESWIDIADGLPSDFGFALAIDPADADSAYVIPLVADIDRVTVGRQGPRLRDTRRRRELDGARERPAERGRLPDHPARGNGLDRRGRHARALLRRHLGDRLRLGRRRRVVVRGGRRPAARLLGQRTGTSTVTVVPPPGGESTSRSPSSASTRSRSPRSPVPVDGSAPPTPSSRT